MSPETKLHKEAGEAFAQAQIAAKAACGMSIPKIVCAANRIVYVDEQGKLQRTVIAGARHCDSVMREHRMRIFELTESSALGTFISEEQGFIDQYGTYYDRFAARHIALEQNQITRPLPSDETMGLCSENLY